MNTIYKKHMSLSLLLPLGLISCVSNPGNLDELSSEAGSSTGGAIYIGVGSFDMSPVNPSPVADMAIEPIEMRPVEQQDMALVGQEEMTLAPQDMTINSVIDMNVVEPMDLCLNNDCNDHGWCFMGNGLCECDPGYEGVNCDQCASGWSIVEEACRPNVYIMGTDNDDDLTGDARDEHIQGLHGDDRLSGQDGNDFINGNQGDDKINGNSGHDDVRGGSGQDEIKGGAGNDVIRGGGGNDNLTGGGGNDRLMGGDGDDYLNGGNGNDRYMFDGLGNDVIEDNDGFNEARCMPGVWIVDEVTNGQELRLVFSTDGSVTLSPNTLSAIWGCSRP